MSTYCCLQYMISSLIFSLLHYFLTSFPHTLPSFTHLTPSFCHFITPFHCLLHANPYTPLFPTTSHSSLPPHFLTPSLPHSLTPSLLHSLTPSPPHPKVFISQEGLSKSNPGLSLFCISPEYLDIKVLLKLFLPLFPDLS